MTQIDENFLASLGLQDLSDDKKQQMMQQLQTELEERIGEKLTAGMSEEQLTEFDGLMEGDEAAMRQWLQTHKPGYEHSKDFEVYLKEARISAGQPVPANVLSAYSVASWIEVNHPNYQEVVSETIEEMKEEIIHNRDVILGKA